MHYGRSKKHTKCRLEVERKTRMHLELDLPVTQRWKKANLRGEDTNNAYRTAAMSDSDSSK